jgi:A/G-specific adenine glycosylase
MGIPKAVSKRLKPDKHLPKVADADVLAKSQTALSKWFQQAARDLPWRSAFKGQPICSSWSNRPKRDPYATWISESMLQQTQVDSVLTAFRRWMKDFPTLSTLAHASESEVMDHWAGLGYYRRAKNLLLAAQGLSGDGWVNLPDQRESLLALPGVGDYTVGAILSLAFGQKEPILDGNVVRVLSRFHRIPFLPTTGDSKLWYWKQALEWAKGPNPGETNEALMELGAMVCTVKQPRCPDCPLRRDCQGLKAGEVDKLPPAKIREKSVSLQGEAWVVRKGDSFLLMQPQEGFLLAGHWNFPLSWKSLPPKRVKAEAKPENDRPGKKSGENQTWSILNSRTRPKSELSNRIQHAITKYRIQVDIVERIWSGPARTTSDLQWVAKADIANCLVTSLARKIWKAYQSGTVGD